MQIPIALLKLLQRPDVTDVMLNSHLETYVSCSGHLLRVPGIFDSAEALTDFAKRAIDAGGNHLDFANPICDVSLKLAELPELSGLGIASLRIHAALALGIASCDLVSIRVHRQQQLTLASFGSELELAKIAGGGSFAVSGSAGSGKTSLLRAMLGLQPEKRTIVIEDTPELLPIQGHFVGLEARAANTEGRGEIDLARLLRESLRMRPDRLVVGEVRGAEVATLLQSFNLGVSQVAFTLHANQPSQLKQRLLSLWLQSGQKSRDLWALLEDHRFSIIHLNERQVTQIGQLSDF